jgi:hypothetical protein
MPVLSKQQVFERWDLLPENLREELVSDVNSKFIWQTCEAEHISDEKIYTISRIAGSVLMGFLHPEDMANEVRDELGIDIRIATSIASAINQRIFTPLRADIDKVYEPVTGLTAPKIFEEVHPPITELIPRLTPTPLTSISSIAPVSTTVAPVALPKQEPIKSPAEKAPSSLDEFARLGKNTPPSPPTPAPKPFVLQTESTSRPIPNAPDFRMPVVAENIMGNKRELEPLPTKTAVIEFGGMPIPKAPAPQSSAAPKVTVVRYGSEKSVPPAMPPKPEPMRTITEITPETFKTAMPTPKAPTQSSFTPLSQIPVPSPIMPKPPTPAATAVPMTPVPPKPISQVPKPIVRPENTAG